MRAFYAHTRATPDEVIDASKMRLQALLSEAVGDSTVIPGRDDFQDRSALEGGWKGWLHSVHSGTMPDGEPRFELLLVPDAVVGKATAQMIEGFLDAGKPVMFWNGLERFAYVVSLNVLPDGNWKQYAEVVISDRNGSTYVASRL